MATPALMPNWLATSAREKFASLEMSRIQAACLEIHTRPGRPFPGLSVEASLAARNWSAALRVGYQAGLDSSRDPALLGSHAWPSAQPVASQTVRSTSP